jgi:hypothetical protein
VQNAALVGGRRPPDALERGADIANAAQEALRQAEVIVRAVADASRETGSRTCAVCDRRPASGGGIRPSPVKRSPGSTPACDRRLERGKRCPRASA